MISVRDLSKTFRPGGGMRDLLHGRLFVESVVALQGLSFEVAPGEILCVMGPNGAGKSTLLRILAGLLLASSGEAEVAGHRVGHDGGRLRRDVSLVVGDERSFYWPLSGRQNLMFFASLHGLSRPAARARVDEMLARVGLAEVADRRFKEYSRGMRQRLAIARGLLGQARVLLLDEPTLGLDPVGAHQLRSFLRDEVVRGEGRTALVGSNEPGEVRALADRVLFLERGAVRGESRSDAIAHFLGIPDV
jgi:ABC-2 type transport system ATP-binding protein